MNKKYLIQNVLVITLGVTLIILSLNYTSSLSMEDSGPAKIETITKNIDFSNIQESADNTESLIVRGPNIIDKSKINFTLNMKENSDYVFFIDVNNMGVTQILNSYILNIKNIDTNIVSEIKNSDVLEFIEGNLIYTVQYSDGKKVNSGDVLEQGTKRVLKISVRYTGIKPANFDFSLDLKYE